MEGAFFYWPESRSYSTYVTARVATISCPSWRTVMRTWYSPEAAGWPAWSVPFQVTSWTPVPNPAAENRRSDDSVSNDEA